MTIDTKQLRDSALNARRFEQKDGQLYDPEKARDHIATLVLGCVSAANQIDAQAAEIARLRDVLDHQLIRDVLGYVEDAGPADVWGSAQSWIALRDSLSQRQGEKTC